MNKILRMILLVNLFFIGISAITVANAYSNEFLYHSTQQNDSPKIVGYYAEWSSMPFASIPAENLDIINYAFANLNADGTISFANDTKDPEDFSKIPDLKKRNPNLKIVLSIGGWTWSKNFSDVAADQALRNKAAQNIAAIIQKYSLDGVDIDWEYPVSGGDNITHRPEDKANYVLFVKDIRDAIGPDKLITIAGPHNDGQYDGGNVANIDLKGMLQYINYINIMGYDLYQSTAKPDFTGNAAPLYKEPNSKINYSIDSGVKDYMNQGLSDSDKQKLILGVPVYGFAWTGVESQSSGLTPGLDEAASGQFEGGFVAYNDLMKNILADQKLIGTWNKEYNFSTYYSPTSKVFVSFDDIPTIIAKANYIKDSHLGGAMFWELSQDTTGPSSLVYNMASALGHMAVIAPPAPAGGAYKLDLENTGSDGNVVFTIITDKKVYEAFDPNNPLKPGERHIWSSSDSDTLVDTLKYGNGPYQVQMTPSSGTSFLCPDQITFGRYGNETAHIMGNAEYRSCSINYY